MDLHIFEKTGSIATTQTQLGHRAPATSTPYSKARSDELRSVVDDRD